MPISANGAQKPQDIQVSYQLIRNLTAPEEKENNVQTFFANVPAYELAKLSTDENLRDYIAEHDPKKRNYVHKSIRSTMDREPDRFINRNSGVTVTCSAVIVDDDKRVATLKNASLVNGAQTRGEILLFREQLGEPDNRNDETPFHVRMEINVDPDNQSVVETAIARNTATPVKSITQAGARGQLDDLETSIRRVIRGAKVRKSETDDEVLETQQILQYTRLVMPESVSGNTSSAEKLRAYKNRAQCLTDFSEWFMHKSSDEGAKLRYDFTVQIAPHVIKEYEHWQCHEAWQGHRLWEKTKKGGRAVRRDSTGRISWVSPGILFPLISALSVFVLEDKKSGWIISKPSLFNEEDMIAHAVKQFRAHYSNPMLMGRSEAAYDALRTYPETLLAVMRQVSLSKG